METYGIGLRQRFINVIKEELFLLCRIYKKTNNIYAGE
jgi:hypothetical protein